MNMALASPSQVWIWPSPSCTDMNIALYSPRPLWPCPPHHRSGPGQSLWISSSLPCTCIIFYLEVPQVPPLPAQKTLEDVGLEYILHCVPLDQNTGPEPKGVKLQRGALQSFLYISVYLH